MNKFIEINVISGMVEIAEPKETENVMDLTFYDFAFVLQCAKDFEDGDNEIWKVTRGQFNALDDSFGIKKLAK